MDYDGLKETIALLMDGGCYKVDISRYQNDMTTFHSRDDILALLIHLGYLGYKQDSREVFIPNRNYPDRLCHYKGNLLLVGVNYEKVADLSSENFKHHSCVIEKA